ncbi:MAG: hypothetical protein O8C61_05750 [Candidatus Methanoperedens sp.]|nr:hypothetical protein [Candidatus Methanoperedens sp.]
MTKKLYILVLVAIIFVAGAANVISLKSSREQPMTIFAMDSWNDEVLNNSFLEAHSENIIMGKVIKILPSKWNTPDGKKPISDDKKPESKEEFYGKQKEYNIYTDVIIKVDKKIKNESTTAVVTVRTLGGQVDEGIMIEEDEAKFELGENVLLFLTKEDPFTDNSAGTHYRVTGWKHGKFSITTDNQAVRHNVPTEHQKIPLEELLKSIGAQ